MRVIAFPRDVNPYQEALYGAMSATRPLEVRYLDGPTGSQTLNVLLLPFQIAVARTRGIRILHLHWVYPFGLVWATTPARRRIVEWWYRLFLTSASALGVKIVWTAHNLVPHEQVFRDDLSARRALVDHCDAVIAHSDHTASTIRTWDRCRVAVIPEGISPPPDGLAAARPAVRHRLGADADVIRVLFFGMIREYKGVDVLLDAMAASSRDVRLEVVIVGECVDPALRDRLQTRAVAIPRHHRVHMQLDFVPEAQLSDQLVAADFAVFPFRNVTNSSSISRALAWGLPVIIPSLSALADVPDDAALRYEPAASPLALAHALERAATMSDHDRAVMSRTARRFANRRTWSDAAGKTWRVFDDLLAQAPRPLPTPAEPQHAEVTQ